MHPIDPESEASGDRLLHHAGNDAELERLAIENLRAVGATGNAVEVIVAVTSLGRGILGVIDGESPVGVEGEPEIAERKAFLRRIGYKL